MEEQILQPRYLMLLVPLSLVMSVPVRYFIKKYNSVVPQKLFMGVFGIIIGLIMTFVNGYEYVGLSRIPPGCLMAAFLPIYIVHILYRIDFNIFKRCLPQALLIVCLEVFLFFLILGCIFKFILHSSWSYTLSCAVALAFIPVQPGYVILMVKELARYKYLGTILETECVFTCVLVFIMFELFVNHLDGTELFWYEMIILLLWSSGGGLLVGSIFGKITALLICWIYNEPQGSLCVFIGATFFTYYLSHYILRVSAPLATVTLVCFIVSQRHRFSTEVDICIDSFWQTLNYMSENVATVIFMFEMVKDIWLFAEPRDIYDIVIIYFCGNIIRLVFFQMIGIVINRMAYNINVRCLLILGWSGVKGIINLISAAMILFTDLENREQARSVPFVMTAYFFLSLLINSSTMRIALRLTGLSELSSTRRTNMNNCMKFVMEKRFSVINMLRLNRYLSDANWKIVLSETIMQHPYKIKFNDEEASDDDDDDEDTLWNASSAICPECYKEVPFDISDKELVEIMNEAEIKIIKAKKVSIIKQFETGILNRNSLEVLIYIFEIMIESNHEDNVVDLRSYLKENTFLGYFAKILLKMDTRSMIEPPIGGQYHKFCYYIMMHIAYDYVLFAFAIIYSVGHVYFLYTLEMNFYYISALIILNIIFILDFQIKITGSANNTLAGLKIYLMEGWNIFDFIMLLLGIVNLIITLLRPVVNSPVTNGILNGLCALRCLKLFYILQPTYPKLIRVIELRSDAANAACYDLATALVNCCDEILDLILQIIEAKKIRDIYTKRIQREKHDLVKVMDHIQKVRPWVAITMKTKQVIRIGLTSMEEALNQLKFSGFVDNIEYSFIYKQIFEKQKFLRNLKYVHPSPPKTIFNEISWLAQDDVIMQFLYDHVKTTTWDVGDVICKSGKKLPGVLIVVTGLLNIIYTPKDSAIDRFQKIGNLPIVDYLSSLKANKYFEDTITSGKTVGELSLLTGRPYDCDIIADTPGHAYVITAHNLRDAMKLKVDPITGLEARIWKHATYNVAVAVLMESSAYQSFTQDQIKSKLDHAFMPNLRCYKMFIITEKMDDVILMEGVVADYNSGDMFIAPMLIPHDIHKLVFPRNNIFEMGCQETMLLILPAGDFAPRDIMEHEEDIAELVSLPSSTCLLHKHRAQQRKPRTRRRKSKNKSLLDTFPAVEFDIEANVKGKLEKNITDAKRREVARVMSKEKAGKE